MSLGEGVISHTIYEVKNSPIATTLGAVSMFLISKKLNAHPIVIGLSTFAGIYIGSSIEWKLKYPNYKKEMAELAKQVDEETNAKTEKFKRSISVNKVNLPDGSYNGLWSAYKLTINSNNKKVVINTTIGMRGKNMPVTVDIKNGEVLY